MVLIFGCQRSGTTMLQQTFLDRSWRILIIEEHDRRLVGAHPPPGETDWQDYPTVVRRLRRIPFEVVAAKPLVESDRAVELMDAAEPVRAVWMLRHYGGVAQSSLRRFGEDNPYLDLQPYCDHDSTDWRSRGASEETRETVIRLMNEGLSSLDAAALFWWARNQLYFDQQLWRDGRIRILRYERACNCSEEVAAALSDFIEIRAAHAPFPPKCARILKRSRRCRSSARPSSGSARSCGTPSRDIRKFKRRLTAPPRGSSIAMRVVGGEWWWHNR